MKIYILTLHNIDLMGREIESWGASIEVVGVYDSLEKAKNAADVSNDSFHKNTINKLDNGELEDYYTTEHGTYVINVEELNKNCQSYIGECYIE